MYGEKKILSINLAQSRVVEYLEKAIETGIYKQPVEGPVLTGICGLQGDIQVDTKNHGGPDKALYVYTHENYRHWETDRLDSSYPYGQFGENLTVTGMPDEQVHIGDIWRIGSIVTQVTQPRVPCFKLGIKMGDSSFVKTFLTSGRVGFYLRVLEVGYLQVGDTLECLEGGVYGLSVRDAMMAIVKGPRQREIIQQALSIPALSEAWRVDLQQRLYSTTALDN